MWALALAPCWADRPYAKPGLPEGQSSGNARATPRSSTDWPAAADEIRTTAERDKLSQASTREHLHPIRASERRNMIAGEEPLTSAAAQSPLLSSFRITRNSTCLIGAETSNVKDEPRRELARRVPDYDPHSAVPIPSLVRMHAA